MFCRGSQRDGTQRDVLLYLPDAVMVLDGPAKQAWQIEYDFEWGGKTTNGLPRTGEDVEFRGVVNVPRRRDHEPGAYVGQIPSQEAVTGGVRVALRCTGELAARPRRGEERASPRTVAAAR